MGGSCNFLPGRFYDVASDNWLTCQTRSRAREMVLAGRASFPSCLDRRSREAWETPPTPSDAGSSGHRVHHPIAKPCEVVRLRACQGLARPRCVGEIMVS